MENMNMVNPFIQYCEEMAIAEEGKVSKFIEKTEKLRQERIDQDNKKRKEKYGFYKSIESDMKRLLSNIIKDYARVFNQTALRFTHVNAKLESGMHDYDLDEISGTYYACIYSEEDDRRRSDVSFDETRECYQKAEKYVLDKYTKELGDKYLDITTDDGSVWFEITVKYKPTKSNESFVDIIMESANNMNTAWDLYSDKMQKLRKEINSEEDISKIISMLSEYYKLVESLKSEIDNAEYSTFDKIKFKVHKTLSTALPLAAFIGTFAGITMLNREVKKKGFTDTIGPISKFTVSAIAGGMTSLKVGSPKDPKKYYTSEITYLLNEIKLQEKLMKKLLSSGIKTISEVDDYNVEVTSSNIKVTRKVD